MVHEKNSPIQFEVQKCNPEKLRESEFTHFVWIATASMAAADKVGRAFNADRASRTEAERHALTDAFNSAVEPDMARSIITRSRIFKVQGMK